MSSSHPIFFCFNPFKTSKKSLTNRFQALAKKWNLIQIQGASKDQYSAKPFLVHVVKEGETLTSISMQYGVPIQSIVAVNASIVDVDLVLEGQCLNIPLNTEEAQKDSTRKTKSYRFDIRESCKSSLNILRSHQNHRVITMLSSKRVHLAKPTGYFLVLVPLIAICISCVIGTFHSRVPKKLNQSAGNESKAHQQGSTSGRWRSVLNDIRESDVSDAESSEYLVNPAEDQSQVPFEDISNDYTELEPAYLKFLSECGMSKWGYWRGGSRE